MFVPSAKVPLLSTAIVCVCLVSIFWFWRSTQATEPSPTTTISRGDVVQSISASGIIETNTASTLGFTFSGTLDTLAVQENDTVDADQVLATLLSTSIEAEIDEAQANLNEATARQQELLAGTTETAQAVSVTQVQNATDALERTRVTQNQLVRTAREKLLSTDLAAVSTDPEEAAPAPIVSGTYRCSATGEYHLSAYRSNATSGYSLHITGLETDTVPISLTQPVPFGECGLRVQFTTKTNYYDTKWNIAVPNINSSTYQTNSNAYETAKTTASSSIAQAEDALALAQKQATDTTAPTRREQLTQARARVDAATARLDRLASQREEHILRAPRAGIITDIDAALGEIVTQPFITFLGTTNSYELKARISETDITYIDSGNVVEIEFDARPEEYYEGVVAYISSLPNQIDGVAYFTATITLNNPPPWLRSGLNADIDIITETRTNTPQLPQGFIHNLTGPDPFVYVLQDDQTTSTSSVTVELIGTDGLAAISNLPLGTTVVAP